jgi:integrase
MGFLVGTAGIEDLRPYDLRHTFATRLLERGIHHYVISALMGHSTPLAGAGLGSRMTPGYAHVSWETMVRAVEVLEQPISLNQNIFSLDSGKIPANSWEARKAV